MQNIAVLLKITYFGYNNFKATQLKLPSTAETNAYIIISVTAVMMQLINKIKKFEIYLTNQIYK